MNEPTLPELPRLYAVTPELDEVLAFLYGAGDLDGAGFLEVPFGAPRYWWRTKLRAALKVEAEAIARAAVLAERQRASAKLEEFDRWLRDTDDDPAGWALRQRFDQLAAAIREGV